MSWVSRAAAAGLSAVAAVAARDLLQREHTLLRNFPVLGHARYLLESVGPELRQYLVAGDNEERPFTRDQRRWVYASAKKENNYFGFGTDNDLEYTAGYPVINHRTFGRAVPATNVHAGSDVRLPCAKVLGAARGRRHAFRPDSVVNISGMSFGALSGNAVTALNRAAALAGCLQNTGEGGISPYHRSGGELVYQIGSGYFGCRDQHGRFDLARFTDTVAWFEPMDKGGPRWHVTFTVADADEVAARTRELGGEVLVEPFDIPWQRIAVIRDPGGATWTAGQFKPPA